MLSSPVARYALFGALGFGIGEAIETLVTLYLYMLVPFPFSFLVAGAVGGASLGVAMKNRRNTIVLAILGALGFTLGAFAVAVIGSFFNYDALLPMGATFGVMVGASVRVAFRNLRRITVLAVAGGVGFSVGLAAGLFIRDSLPMARGVGLVVAAVIGGALLGAALGYLESYRPVPERRPPE